MTKIDLSTLYTETAKISELVHYTQQAIDLAGEGEHIILTGAAPVWLYLSIAHALHGKTKTLTYQSPGLKDANNVEGNLLIFNHDAY